MSKIKVILEKATQDILAGNYGKIGNKYITIRQFASNYKVSYKTASKAFIQLKANGFISQSTKSYFISDFYATKNASKNYMLIGVHVRDMSNNFYASLCSALSLIAPEHGVQLIFMDSNNDNANKRSILKKFIELKCDGVINLNSFKEYELADFYKIYPLPQVFFGINPIKGLHSDFLLTDNISSGKVAAKHLLDCGSKIFVYLTANDLDIENDDRQIGFKSYLSNNNIEDCTVFKFDSDKISSPYYSHLANFLVSKSKNGKVGVFCHHDGFAANVLNICNKYKVSVPNTVAVLGYDNLPLTQYTTPQISTFSYDFKEIAKNLISKIKNRIYNPLKATSTIIFPTYLMIRNSTKPTE